MADWNPSLYLQFDAERTRPAADLLSRIAHLQVEHAVDQHPPATRRLAVGDDRRYR